ncbi:MAG: hypothetical protein D3905_02815 [Candidatus Electrothrix sp. AS4_5]|nr:hypothetical protein [Candidatus Electrothrix gigas]
MTTTLTLDSKYVTVLQALGNVDDALKDAIRGYAMTHISERIGQIQHEILQLQSQYGLSYEQFYVDITTNEEFVMQLRETHPTWERDLNNWEYYQEELATWLGHLESILKM